MGGSSVCPCNSVYCMDKLCVLLMPPRSSVSLLGSVVSSSIVGTQKLSASAKRLLTAMTMIVSF
jgi:hypothetical protein